MDIICFVQLSVCIVRELPSDRHSRWVAPPMRRPLTLNWVDRWKQNPLHLLTLIELQENISWRRMIHLVLSLWCQWLFLLLMLLSLSSSTHREGEVWNSTWEFSPEHGVIATVTASRENNGIESRYLKCLLQSIWRLLMKHVLAVFTGSSLWVAGLTETQRLSFTMRRMAFEEVLRELRFRKVLQDSI